ncbi:MAG: thioredoxin family protein [Pirellulaceae bacterium]|nr:thioredoxin family protein [Pirellulaceae bacterium]
MSKTRFYWCLPIALFAVVISTLMVGCSATNRLPAWMNFSTPASESLIDVPWGTSFAEARVEAAESEKLILLWFTGSDWCKYCVMLENEVFHTPEFTAWYGDKIVPVVLDFPRQSSLEPELERQNEMLKERYSKNITSYPTALFVNSNGQVMGKLGYLPGGAEVWTRKADEILALAF